MRARWLTIFVILVISAMAMTSVEGKKSKKKTDSDNDDDDSSKDKHQKVNPKLRLPPYRQDKRKPRKEVTEAPQGVPILTDDSQLFINRSVSKSEEPSLLDKLASGGLQTRNITCPVTTVQPDRFKDLEKNMSLLWQHFSHMVQPVHIHVYGGKASQNGDGDHGADKSPDGHRSHEDKVKKCSDKCHCKSLKNSSSTTNSDSDKSAQSHFHGHHDHSKADRNESHGGHSHGHSHGHGHMDHGHGHRGHGHSHGSHKPHHSHGSHNESADHDDRNKTDSHKDHGYGHDHGGHSHGHKGDGHDYRGHRHDHRGHRHGHDHGHKGHDYGHGHRCHSHCHSPSRSHYKGDEQHFGRGHSTHVHIHVTVDEKTPVKDSGETTHHEHPDFPHVILAKNETVYARCDIRNHDSNTNLAGYVLLRQMGMESVQVKINISGFPVPSIEIQEEAGDVTEATTLSPSEGLAEQSAQTPNLGTHLHGFHVHEFGDFSRGCLSFGGHFNPEGVVHGGLDHHVRHVGDWGNIEVNNHGEAIMAISVNDSTLLGRHSLLGRGIVIHEEPDDLGEGGTAVSHATGSAGARIACCVIARSKPLPEDEWAIPTK